MRKFFRCFLLSIFCAIWIINLGISASRDPVRARHGMVVTSQELASQVGVEILKKGGNAIDAAVAVGFALAVVYPTAGNLGGGGFMVIRFPDGRVTSIDFRERAPEKAHRDMYLDEQGQVIPELSTLGYLACGVPGTVAGLTLALEKYGTMSLKQVLQPAIKLAEQGFRVNYYLSQDLKGLAETFLKFPASAKVFLNKGKPYQEGELFVQKDLARTLRLITKKGRDAFYQGSIAELIAEDMEKHHGLITKKDLAEYRAVEREPVQGEYRGYKIIAMGPPSSGGIALIELLNILEGFDMGQMGHNSSRALHLLTEAMRRVFADRACYLGDSDYCNVPVSGLLSKQYAHGLRESINLFQATPSSQVREGNPLPYESDQTTHYSVVDKDRLAVAVTTTINEAYGSKVVVEGTGFLLNNEMDDFSVKPGAPNLYGLIGSEANAIAPGKRMLSSMSPTIVEKDGQLFLVLGARGGPAIITSLVQVILNVIDYGLTIQEAIDAPRIHHQWLPDQLLYERVGFPYDVLENLTRMGHEVQERKGYGSEAHAIMVEPETKILLGAADSRGEGKALGY